MLTACPTHIPLPRLPAHVVVVRHRHRLRRGAPIRFLQAGDRVTVGAPARLRFSYGGNRFTIPHGAIELTCAGRALTVALHSGRVEVRSGRREPRGRSWSAASCSRSPPRAATTFVVGTQPKLARHRARGR